MIVFSHPIALAGLASLILAAMAWSQGAGGRQPGPQRAAALGLRCVLLAAISLGLAGAQLRLPQDRQAVAFVADRSASDGIDSDVMLATINAALGSRPAKDQAAVVSFGRRALVEQPPSALAALDGFQTAIDPSATNLEGGLELGASLLPGNDRRRIVLLSDGQQNVGDALAAARLLRAQGIRVDIIPQPAAGGPDAAVESVQAPSQLQVGERFQVTVAVRSSVDTPGRIDLLRDGAPIVSESTRFHAGMNRYVFGQPPLSPGFHAYQVHIEPQIDARPENDSGSAAVTVSGAPQVLVVASSPAEAGAVLASLRSTHIVADLQSPAEVSSSLADLQRYAGIVLVDTPAPSLSPSFLEQLVPYVRDLGRGLVVIGGQQSYGVGGYGGTPLERVLPVRMDLPNRKELPTAAVVLIIESLEAEMPVNISKAAGKAVVQLLTERDQIAINDTPDGGGDGWVVRLQPARNKPAIERYIDAMRPGDPISYVTALRRAYQVLRGTSARVRHIILLGDGDAPDPRYAPVVKAIHAAGVTVSTVITNGLADSDFATMRDIARWGGGRYYRADDVTTIPRVFLRETKTVAGSGIVEGRIRPHEVLDAPMLHDLGGFPLLTGYVATALKPTGQLFLSGRKLDPVLAGWQYGLGRAIAWTSDAAGLWTKDWLATSGAQRFWSDLVSWTLPTTARNQLLVTAGGSPGAGRVSVTVPSTLGAGARATALITTPTGRAVSVSLQPSAPGRYEGDFPALQQGVYFVTVQATGNGHTLAGQASFALPYAAEFRLAGTNTSFLERVAAAGGGSVLRSPRDVWADNLPPAYDYRSLAGFLWLFALLLLPVDVAVRRLTLRRDPWRIAQRRRLAPEPVRLPGSIASTGPTPERVPELVFTSRSAGPVTPIVTRPTSVAEPRSAERGAAVSTASRLLAAKRRREGQDGVKD